VGWWRRLARRAATAQAHALLFLLYYPVLAPFALIARGRRGATGWIPRDGEPAPSLRRQS
jgi:hypothetical protein